MLSLLGLSRLSMSEAVGHGRPPGASSDQPLRSRCMSRARLALLPATELTVADSSQLLPITGAPNTQCVMSSRTHPDRDHSHGTP